MEKRPIQPLESNVAASVHPKQRHRSLSIYLIALLVVTAFGQVLFSFKSSPWLSNVKHIGKLISTDCWDLPVESNISCYHLYAPLDYLDWNDDRTAKLAVVIYHAGGGKTPKEELMGTILVNPGGPGGSGVGFLAKYGATFDKLTRGRYNYLSWDPRGVGKTSPLVDCRRIPGQVLPVQPQLSRSSAEAIPIDFQKHRLLSKLCADNPAMADELRFVGTPSTARDMRLLYRAVGDRSLNYWGFSYGTVLGSVFADMFPDEVRRVVLDGVVDVPGYLAGHWDYDLIHTQDIYEKGLLGGCAMAKDKCALNSLVGKASDLKETLDHLLQGLIAEPIISTQTSVPLLDYSSFKRAIFQSLYQPTSWPAIANATAQLLQGNATTFIDEFISINKRMNVMLETRIAIEGGDVLTRREAWWSVDDYRQVIADLENQSSFSGELTAESTSLVQAWSIISNEQHQGNLSASTRHPILFVGNDNDPVTPIESAKKMATMFANASLLRIKAYGHCSTAQPSKCADQAISDYFLNGAVPNRKVGANGLVEPGKTCEVDRMPWDDFDQDQVEELGMSYVQIW